MSWKCKKCRCSKFRARTKEYQITDFDKNGEKTYTYLGGETIIEEVECNRCKTKGKSIQDIAVWEE